MEIPIKITKNLIPLFHRMTLGKIDVFPEKSVCIISKTFIPIFLYILTIYTLRFTERPRFPGPTPFVNPLAPSMGAYSSGTQLICKLALPC
mmetsp:Transcript_13579/g.16488  ORF Transcript_13579/g.16488 Transcript_13579/m.16488 type:complete len:91 (+) Transcript_13579:85-357(+)